MANFNLYHRKPTAAEISFGYGATHYIEPNPDDITKADGTPKRWYKNPVDGLRYYR